MPRRQPKERQRPERENADDRSPRPQPGDRPPQHARPFGRDVADPRGGAASAPAMRSPASSPITLERLRWRCNGTCSPPSSCSAPAYTLLRGEHVKIDILYGQLPRRRAQLWIDIFGTLFFLLPLCVVTIHLVWPVVVDKIAAHEMSANSGGLSLWPVWALIPAGFVLLALQGLSEIIKRLAFLAADAPDPVARPRRSAALSRGCRDDRLPRREPRADHVRLPRGGAAARLSRRLRARRQRLRLRLGRHRTRPVARRTSSAPSRTASSA